MELSKKIIEQRKKAKLSQEKLAELTGVSRQAVTKWENGTSFPDTENLIRLSEVFKISIDELCLENKPETSKAKPFVYGNILALISALIVIFYCIASALLKSFSGEILIMLSVIAFPMHIFLHFAFYAMLKNGDFSMLAGFDPDIRYNMDGIKPFLMGLDFFIGVASVSYLFLIAVTALIIPKSFISVLLLIGYVFSYIFGIIYMNFRFSDRLYLDPSDRIKGKRSLFSSMVFILVILISVGALVAAFYIKDIENNSIETLPYLGFTFLSLGFSSFGYFTESKRLKKFLDPKPFFGKAFITFNILAIFAAAAMLFI